ncbi:MAG: S8/S53 family peptidase, partial [Acidimicrobiales bacterium]
MRRSTRASQQARSGRGGWLRPAVTAGTAVALVVAPMALAGAAGNRAAPDQLPPAPQWVSSSPYTPHRPSSCTTPTATSLTDKPTAGQPATSTGSVPWPAAPAGTNPTDYAAYLHTTTTTPPVRPSNWDMSGGTWKLSSARTNPSGDPALAKNPQELCGVMGGSVDTAWQTTTGQPSTLLAVTDSGIEWCDPGIVDKIYVNPAALPPPENAAGKTKSALQKAGTTFTDSTPYDLKDTGVVNAAQYGTDPRVKAVARDYGSLFCGSATRGPYPAQPTLVSPMDLIRTFGTPTLPDGTPNPYFENRQSPAGFTEAISGWNFVNNNNNPFDDVHYDHGTGEAEDSTGAANTLTKEVGACPSCMVLPVRVGDSFVTSGNMFAQGVLFAVDSGATVVQEALGTVNVTKTAQQAVAYAEAHGVPVVASAADEEASHHNLPSSLAHTIVVNSVTKDTTVKPPSYLYLNGCTNYGPNIAVSVESASCSSEATGKASGIVGLAESAAANAMAAGTLTAYPGLTSVTGKPVALSVNEIRQLVTMSASAVDFRTATSTGKGKADNYTVATGPYSSLGVKTTRYASHAGFNQYFGYGRINAAAIVTWIAHGQIPPQAQITSPTWFGTDNPGGSLQVSGTVGTPGSLATGWQYQVDVGVGATPSPGSWHLVATGTGTGVVTKTLADIPLSDVAALFPAGTDFTGGSVGPGGTPQPDRFTFSVRVVVRATGGPTKGLIGVSRRAEYLHQGQSTLAGFPQHFASSLDGAPKLAPIGPGGTNVLLVPTSGGSIYALEPGGGELPGWPVHTDPLAYHATEPAFSSGAVTAVPRGEIIGGLAVGDLADATGPSLDVVACDLSGRCYAWNAQGQLLPGYPVRNNPTFSGPSAAANQDNRVLPGIAAAPALADLTGNGTLDVVAASEDRHVYAWGPTGQPVPGWPVLVVNPSKVTSVNPTTNQVTFLPTTHVNQGTKLMDTPAIGNLGGSGPPDVVVGSSQEYTGPANAALTSTLSLLAGSLSSANATVFAIYPDGTLHPSTAAKAPPGTDPQAFLPGWPAGIADLEPGLLPDVADGVVASPALAQVNGQLDVGVMSAAGPAYVLTPSGASALGNGPTGRPRVMTASTPGPGSNSTGLLNTSIPALGAPVFAPLGAGAPGTSLVAPALTVGKTLDEGAPANQTPHQNQVDAWNASTGAFDAGFPQQMNTLQFLVSPIVADVAGGSTPYVVEGSATSDLRALDAQGQEAPGFPKFTGGWMVNSPVYGPFGSLATQVLAAGTRTGTLFVWQTTTPATASCGPWPEAHHDLWNTGNLEEAAAPGSSCATAPTGYTEVAADGGVFAFGTAGFYGSMGGKHLNAPVVGIAATPTGHGYTEVASDGGVFAFGTAGFYGSMGGKHLNAPVVGIAATPTGQGYWEVAADGGVFAFGTAGFYGSMGGKHLNAPVVGIAATPTGQGYTEVAADGGVFA